MFIPLNPVAASRARVPRYGKPYYVGKYEQYRKDMTDLVPLVLKRAGISNPIEGPLEVSALFLMDRPRTSKLLVPHQDVDNLLKAVLDSLNGKLWVDDKQIVKLTGEKTWAKKETEGQTVIMVRKL